MSSSHRSRLTRGVLVVLAVSTTLSAELLISTAAAADTDIRMVGGAASSAVVCGNVAAAQNLSRQRGIAIQRSRCTAQATGGSVALTNVDIYVLRTTRMNGLGDAVLSALDTTDAAGVAASRCEDHRPPTPPGTQLNKCWAIAHGGRLVMKNVMLVNHHSDGSASSRSVADMVLSTGDGSAQAACANVVSDPLDQRDDCAAATTGATWSMRGVDVVVHNPDGTSTTRRGIDVEVAGGNANADIYCFNMTDGRGHVIQINICDADAQGGDATLRDVTIHTGS